MQGHVPEKMTALVFRLKPWHSVLFTVHLISVVIDPSLQKRRFRCVATKYITHEVESAPLLTKPLRKLSM